MIQPMDIKSQSFKKGLFGYKTLDVDTYVDSVYRAYDEVYRENQELSDSLEKLNKSLQELRLKTFDMENKLQQTEVVGSADDGDAKKRADEIIKNAEKTAADIIAKAKAEAAKTTGTVAEKETAKEAEKPAEETKESASSRFFKKAEETAPKADDEDDDEIFVGEIEDARKPDRMMIGDGEEEEDMDFEFL